MLKQIYFTLFISSLFFVCSCSVNKSVLIVPSASINKPNFKIIKTVTGYAETKHYLAFGGINSNGLTSEAKVDLYKNANLKDNQTIANITLDSKISHLFLYLYWKEQVYISADVVEFFSEDLKVNNSVPNTDSNSQPFLEAKPKSDNFISNENEGLISNEERLMLKFLLQELTTSKYQSLDEVRKNDYIQFATDFGDKINGKVSDVSNPNKIKVIYFSPSHTKLYWETSWKELTKLIPSIIK